jgi:hypothetical protein
MISYQVHILERPTHQISWEAEGNEFVETLAPALLGDLDAVTIHEVAAITDLEE